MYVVAVVVVIVCVCVWVVVLAIVIGGIGVMNRQRCVGANSMQKCTHIHVNICLY